MIAIKRAYDPPGEGDGVRVLVDRLWPRGVTKTAAKVDRWMRELAPSTALRKWFGHDPARWAEFRRRYFKELTGQGDAIAELRKLARGGSVTLVYGAKDVEHNDAVALKAFLERRAPAARKRAKTPPRSTRRRRRARA
jgi:uncharacterized protein YeaO (DUF488 family)